MTPPGLADVLAVVLAAAAFRVAYWEALFRLGRTDLAGPAAASRAVSSAHAAAVVAIAAGAPTLCGAWGAAARAVSVGYLAHDLHLLLTCPGLRDPPMVIHHLSAAALIWGGVGSLCWEARWAFFAEAPVPFLNLAWLFRREGRAPSRAAGAATDAAVLVLFAVTRLAALPLLAGVAARAGERLLAGALLCLGGLSWLRFGRLARGAIEGAGRAR